MSKGEAAAHRLARLIQLHGEMQAIKDFMAKALDREYHAGLQVLADIEQAIGAAHLEALAK